MLKFVSSFPLSGQKINFNKNGYKGSRSHHIEFLMLAGMTTEYSQIRLQKFRTIEKSVCKDELLSRKLLNTGSLIKRSVLK
jgi:hypothetical protein